jgi:hypothetical protein
MVESGSVIEQRVHPRTQKQGAIRRFDVGELLGILGSESETERIKDCRDDTA